MKLLKLIDIATLLYDNEVKKQENGGIDSKEYGDVFLFLYEHLEDRQVEDIDTYVQEKVKNRIETREKEIKQIKDLIKAKIAARIDEDARELNRYYNKAMERLRQEHKLYVLYQD